MLNYNLKQGLTSSYKPFEEEVITLKLKIDLPFVKVLGVLEFNDGIFKIEEFKQEGGFFVLKYEITKERLPFCEKIKLFLSLSNDGLEQKSNKVLLEVNQEVVAIKIKKINSDEIKALAIKLAKVENILSNIQFKGVLNEFVKLKPEDVKPGMTLVATGNGFTAAYPFADFVKTINDVSAEKEHITLTLKDLPYQPLGLDGEKVVQLLLETVKAQAELLQNVLANQEVLAQEIKNLKLTLAEHLSTALF
jgi:hypothetical protein